MSYNEKLNRVDLKLAHKDKDRRVLVQKRGVLERELQDIEEVTGSMLQDGGGVESPVVAILHEEKASINASLDETYLSIARIDREKKELRGMKKDLESVVQD